MPSTQHFDYNDSDAVLNERLPTTSEKQVSTQTLETCQEPREKIEQPSSHWATGVCPFPSHFLSPNWPIRLRLEHPQTMCEGIVSALHKQPLVHISAVLWRGLSVMRCSLPQRAHRQSFHSGKIVATKDPDHG
jgi:hypothetical protein